MKAFISDYTQFCALCGRPKTDLHHCIFNTSNRKKCDEDAILLPLCRNCHDKIHHDASFGYMSKILGQTLWELNTVASEEEIKDARAKFTSRYGKSYL